MTQSGSLIRPILQKLGRGRRQRVVPSKAPHFWGYAIGNHRTLAAVRAAFFFMVRPARKGRCFVQPKGLGQEAASPRRS